MAGGTGERFWPLSRASRPKQLLKLTDPNQTLLEESVRRIEPLVGESGVYVITGRHLQKPIEDSGILFPPHIWVEPQKKNTLGALVWVTANLIAQDREDSTLAILTADHKISDPDAFRGMVDLAMATAEETGGLVTCGIVPTRPETGYGYIELDRRTTTDSGSIRSKGFREKPDLESAIQFVNSGDFLWNSGMFFWTTKAFLRELESAQPEVHAICFQIANALKSNEIDAANAAFDSLPSLSVDYAVMEKASEVWVVEAKFGWDDVGAWDSLTRTMPTNQGGNVEVGDVLAIDCKNVVFYNESGLKLTAVGIENIVAVATEDAILLCPIDQAQRVKEVVERLKGENPELLS